MRRASLVAHVAVVLASLLALGAPALARPPAPPVAPRYPSTTTVHGEQLRDDYAWMRERGDPAVRAHLEAEDRYAAAMMAGTAAFQEKLYQEMVGRIQETDMNVPYTDKGWLWYTRTEKGKQYAIHARKKTAESAEEVILDGNELAQGKPFFSLRVYAVSDDAHLVAYGTDEVGFRQYTVRIKDLRTGKLGAEAIPRVTTAAWAADGKTLFYTQEDPETKRSHRLYRHTLGQPVERDVLVHDETDARFGVYVSRTLSERYLVMSASSSLTSDARVLPADQPAGEWKLVAPRVQGVEYDIDHRGDLFYIKTNDRGRNFRLVTAPVASPGPESWKEVIPHRDDVMLTWVTVFANHLVMGIRKDAIPDLVVRDLETGAEHVIETPDPVHSIYPSANPEFDTTKLRFSYTSQTTPTTIYEVDMRTRERAMLKQQPVLGGFDPARYQTERTHARAGDGTMVPISLVYEKGTKRDGKSPLLLRGYGSYGYPYDVGFSSSDLSLLDRGVVIGIAHIRGGGDLGKRWHEEGRMGKKMNTFTDFIAVAEHLIRERYTSPRKLVITGGSAGGLLMGVVLNLRPDLFKAAVVHVPFVDVVNTMLDPGLPLTVGEFEEWGNPAKKEEYAVLRAYSPYENVGPKKYPAMLVKTGFHDSQVMYWEPAKWVAKLRATKKDKNPLLFKVNFKAGHGGSSGRYDKLREVAFDHAYILGQVGITR